MEIKEFVSGYTNHPVLFIGTGISLRYLNNSYTWDGLLSKISVDLYGDDREYLNLKYRNSKNGVFRYEEIAECLEVKFNEKLENEPEGDFKEINDKFFESMREHGEPLSRFKIYIAKLLSTLEYRDGIEEELIELKKARKNIGSIVTTNYDNLVQEIFEFNPLIGNDILLSNPYGSAYKIHGCVDDPSKIIITQSDYDNFESKYELIRSQLLSLFIHNPIIFLGYNIGDENIKAILKTVFTYVPSNSEIATKIKKNFLLVEYEQDSENIDIVAHDIDIEGFSTISINKIRTNNFSKVYEALSELNLPISAMDIRKFQSIAKEIYEGGNIKVSFTEDMDSLDNSDKVVAIGSKRTIQYNFQTISEMISNYFKIIEDSNDQLLLLINKQKISNNQYFPIFGFSQICTDIDEEIRLKKQQISKINGLIDNMSNICKNEYNSIQNVLLDEKIFPTNKAHAIIWGIWHNRIGLEEVFNYLKSSDEKKDISYKKILCVYDYKKYVIS